MRSPELRPFPVTLTFTFFVKGHLIFLAGLQSNSGLWIDDVRLSVCLSVRPSVCPSVRLSTFGLPMRLSSFSVTFISADLIHCMGIDLGKTF